MEKSHSNNAQTQRAVTVKSILFGLLGICIVSGLAGFHDNKIGGSLMVGTFLPVGAYFFIVLVALVWNLVFSRTLPALVLSSKELIVVMGMTLMACFPPTSGLLRYFHRMLVLPWYYLNTGGQTEWEKFGVLNYLPSKLFPQPAPVMKDGILQLDDTVYRGFFTGLAKGNETIGISDIPFGAWIQPLMYWGPLVILMSICVMGLSLLVHQQWAHHEQLSYPLAQVASSFLTRKQGKGVPDLFRSKLFWWGFIPILTLYALEYLHLWFPEYIPGLSNVLPNVKNWQVDINSKIPILQKIPGHTMLGSQNIYFSVIGIAYFVSSEISLTMGLSSILLAVVGASFFTITGTPLADGNLTTARSGAYLGYALILLYTGRSYYLAILKKAFGMGKPTEYESASVMAARIVILSFAGFVITLVMMGLDWMIALLFSFFLMILFLVFTRIICETGIPFMQAYWRPGPFLISILGPSAIGPGPIVFIMALSGILCQDPRECLMPYVATSIKMVDDAKLHITRMFWVLTAAVVIALAVAFVSTSWTLYNFGGMSIDTWAQQVPANWFNDAARQISELNETGVLEQSRELSGLAKLKLFSMNPTAWGYLLAGIIVVFVFSILRFRFAHFPLHPVLFLVWGSYAAAMCWYSFLIGWGIKGLVVRFGGGRVFQNLKPIFIGMIAGELIAVGTSIFIETIYYWVVGHVSGIDFTMMPG